MTSDYNSQNTYVKSIVDEIKGEFIIQCDTTNFWSKEEKFDIIHIQWVEELLGWYNYDLKDIKKLELQLNVWKSKGSKIVMTLHNELPHVDNILNNILYSTVYKYLDVVIHLGNYSYKYLKVTNKDIVIPHVNYYKDSIVIPNKKAKQYISIPSDTFLFLSFGKIRDIAEEKQIIKAFKKVRAKNDLLLILGTKILGKRPQFKKNPIKRITYELKKQYYLKKGIYFEKNRIYKDKLKYYLNAADVVICPRIKTLNSGVIYQGFSYGKVVLGPDIGNIGSILKTMKNPVFKPKDSVSIQNALTKAKYLSKKTNKGELNLQTTLKENNSKKIGLQHCNLYKSILLNLC